MITAKHCFSSFFSFFLTYHTIHKSALKKKKNRKISAIILHLFLGKIRFGRDNISIYIKPRIDIFISLILFAFPFLSISIGIIGYSVRRKKEFFYRGIEFDPYEMINKKYTETFFRYRTDLSI